MADQEPVHQFLVTEAEMKLLHALRDQVPEEESEESNIKLRYPVQLMAFDGDRHLGDYTVDGISLVAGCACVGAKIRAKLIEDPVDVQAPAGLDVEDEQELTNGDAMMQAMTEEILEEIPWEEIRTDHIPPYIQNVTFTAAKVDLTEKHRKELAERFPGVTVQDAPSPQSGPNRSAKRQAVAEQPFEKPIGVKTVVFELDRNSSTSGSVIEASLRNQYPWAEIKTPHTLTGPREDRLAQDIENHLQDLANYMVEYPRDSEFDAYLDRTVPWENLPLRRKLSIAHARAVQHGRCGESRGPESRCVRCKIDGYTCRVYRPQFVKNVALTSRIYLGDGCQHCRLLNVDCTLAPYREQSKSSSAAKGVSSDRSTNTVRPDSMDTVNETTVTTPTAPRKLSLADRITREQSVPAPHVANLVLQTASDITNLGQSMGFKVARADIVFSMHQQWKCAKDGDVRAFNPKTMQLQHYYLNLVDLYIIAHATQNRALEFATLLRFQVENFEQKDDLPDINAAVIKAFEYLPAQSSLCRWIALMFAYNWDTVYDGHYDDFKKKNQDLSPEALATFLYEVAYIRDSHTEGGMKEVHRQWCNVHDEHEGGSTEDRRCMEEERKCKRLIQDISDSSPQSTGKRKLDGLAGIRNKKSKRNQGQQYGR